MAPFSTGILHHGYPAQRVSSTTGILHHGGTLHAPRWYTTRTTDHGGTLHAPRTTVVHYPSWWYTTRHGGTLPVMVENSQFGGKTHHLVENSQFGGKHTIWWENTLLARPSGGKTPFLARPSGGKYRYMCMSHHPVGACLFPGTRAGYTTAVPGTCTWCRHGRVYTYHPWK